MSITSPSASPPRPDAARRSSTGLPIHVRPTDGGDWEVRPEGRDQPTSIHPTADAAERAAEAEAEARGGVVVLRDCYSRVHRMGGS